MDNRWRPLALTVVVVLMAAGAPSFAQQPPGAPAAPVSAPPAGVGWSSLSPDQQRVLSQFGSQWNTLPPERQQALAHGSDRWLGMSDTQRDQARERFSRWRALPPEQRQALRSRWQRFQDLPPGEQARARESYRRFQQLPPERRATCCASSGAMPHRHSASSGSSARAPNTRDTVRAHRAHTWHHRTCQGRRHITEPAAPPAFAQTRDRPFYRVTPPFAAGRTGTGTLQTSTRPAGTLNHSSWRLRRASR